MDDLIQILLFVLTFVLIVFSAIRKQKKPNSKQASTVDISLESLFGIPQVEEPQSRVREFPVEEADDYEFGTDEGVSEPIPEIVNQESEFVEVEEEKEESQSKIAHDFDLRKAVIYSEILNRKAW